VEAGSGEAVKVVSDIPIGAQFKRGKYAVIKAWPRINAVFIDFFPAESNLVRITARIKDEPGSLYKLSEAIGANVNLNAIDELHHDEVSGVWNAYGVLVLGDLDDLVSRARKLDTVVKFQAHLLT
jgi:hypothetical protein